MKHSYSNDDTCFSIDVIDEILEEDFDALLDEDIPGICPSFWKHNIQLLDDKKPVVQKQRRKRIFKKRNKKKAKHKQIQAREGKDQEKSKAKVSLKSSA
ncbi:hypothetical protein Tco_0767622 [Tanacetum coccineum]